MRRPASSAIKQNADYISSPTLRDPEWSLTGIVGLGVVSTRDPRGANPSRFERNRYRPRYPWAL